MHYNDIYYDTPLVSIVDRDIAILKLTDSIVYIEYVKPICMPRQKQTLPQPGKLLSSNAYLLKIRTCYTSLIYTYNKRSSVRYQLSNASVFMISIVC